MATGARVTGVRAAGLAAMLMALPPAAGAVTWTIDFGSAASTFEAPAAGGPATGLLVTLGGVSFDTPDSGTRAPVFDAASNDFSGAGGGIFSYYLSAAGDPGCAGEVCLLEFENRVDPFTPPLWAAFPLVMGVPGAVFANGNYQIAAAGPAPIPLPAPLALMAAAVAALGVLRLRRG